MLPVKLPILHVKSQSLSVKSPILPAKSPILPVQSSILPVKSPILPVKSPCLLPHVASLCFRIWCHQCSWSPASPGIFHGDSPPFLLGTDEDLPGMGQCQISISPWLNYGKLVILPLILHHLPPKRTWGCLEQPCYMVFFLRII